MSRRAQSRLVLEHIPSWWRTAPRMLETPASSVMGASAVQHHCCLDVMVLNCPVPQRESVISLVRGILPQISLSDVRSYAVDGGLDVLLESVNDDIREIPDGLVVVGDFDSARKESLNSLGSRVAVVHDPRQDNTDFEKALEHYLLRDDAEGHDRELVVIAGFGGRRDHEFAQFNAMWKFMEDRASRIPVDDTGPRSPVLLDPGNTVRLLWPGIDHRVVLSESFQRRDGIGLIPFPFSSTSGVRTEGLRWDLQGHEDVRFGTGGVLSTSNELADGQQEFWVRSEDSPLLCVTRNDYEAIVAETSPNI